MASAPELILYTNHTCPWAHRAHIALAELGLPFKEEIIDLNTPRTEAYLKINPRGLVPALSYNGEIITESGIVAQFLADAHPSHLLPASDAKDGALRRARINFLRRHVLLQGQPAAGSGFIGAQFVGGEERVWLKQMSGVQTGSFILRVYSSAEYGLLPKTIIADLADQAPNFTKWADAVRNKESVNAIYDGEYWVKRTRERFAKAKA
ncbi:conserved hypothetical protein [Verticillium alfalfae VaMs.102]|uniref:GST N-terminal domain-containing protein n=1 Tax=Verticillium alfalfae (strain VaMs.102 / ATCC MYA-4576 / FGSC 10136) TaxID=526221 RepID=C9SRY9_VERA1|nr:conserved hypothetical protein [Verticillium alfalfae VaMs.102]EEY21554.1 conserved hypothetical protein [Verticillium alfalfae VaMs.102]